MHIALVLGTRPEAIKLAPIADLLGPEAFVIHTRQHYNAGMNGQLAPDLVLDRAHHETRASQLGSWTSALEFVLRIHRPECVIVQGDTTSALAGALATNALGIPLAHVEAGLRSFDRSMPEEHNRVLIDHLADLCFAPTPLAYQNLLAERIPAERIEVVGNTIVEAVTTALPNDTTRTELLKQLGLESERFILATVHRPENADHPHALVTILRELSVLPLPIVLPLHPRTQRTIVALGMDETADALRLTGPLDYPALLSLIQHAAMAITDSGGVQEEATVLKRPILVVRRSNERPEVEATFGSRVVPGAEISAITQTWLSELETRYSRLHNLTSPYGDGTASARVVHAVRRRLAKRMFGQMRRYRSS